jgi:hypothetical protein
MTRRDPWAPYAPSYRSAELRQLAGWIAAGASGAVVGLVGSGRSNLLRYVCEHPTALRQHLPDTDAEVALVAVDLYDLPSDNLADLYRTILHAFYWARERLPGALGETAAALYLEHRASTDAFLTQTALYDLLLAFQRQGVSAVLVLNRFDRFCQTGTLPMVNSLRSLRDRFRWTLSYIAGMRQAVAYLPNPASLGDMYELFDAHTCYVGALTPEDSRYMLAALPGMEASQPGAEETAAMLRLSGGFPILLKAIGQWWLGARERPAVGEWLAVLLENAAIQYRVERLWQGLTQEEQLALVGIARSQSPVRAVERHPAALRQRNRIVMERLAATGCCAEIDGEWLIPSELLGAYATRTGGNARGRIWFDDGAQMIFQGQQSVDTLTPLESDILRFLLANPRVRHTSDAIIERVWPADDNKEVITPNNLQVHVSSIRKKIEPNPSEPLYLITWHGRPGGYQFFPEGKPK